MVPPGMVSVHKAQTSDHFGPLPNGDGGGRGGRGLSVYRRAVASFILIVRAQRAADSTGAVRVGNVRSVRCAMQ